MEETFRAADALQTEVEPDLEDEERQAAIDDWAACRQRYRVEKFRARARMVGARRECPIGGDNVSVSRPAVRTGNGRLPEVANIHKRGDLDNTIKFTYLLSSTEGTARRAIEGISLTPENYTHAVDILKERFGRPRMVIRKHRAPACHEMTARGIQSLVDEVTKHLRCLTALDKDSFTGRLPVCEALMPMLQAKRVGSPSRREKTRNHQIQKSRNHAAKSEQQTPTKKPSRPEWKQGERIRSTAAALAVVAAHSCLFCSGEHKAEECEKFLQADLFPRRDMVEAKDVCFNCLATGHLPRGCRDGGNCGVDGCRQPHHKLLHPSSTMEWARSLRSD
ncbi:hypothetical protein T02_4448 [Trichinella nativa]|uniref:CCHC-type domain-containing protein n=1 Tax=Trichinella nativa TaxID=6335 RepID=A0A0V1KLR5_9BILA|nr:hypothetical protein T02_4448 [Trichinella nativa]